MALDTSPTVALLKAKWSLMNRVMLNLRMGYPQVLKEYMLLVIYMTRNGDKLLQLQDLGAWQPSQLNAT